MITNKPTKFAHIIQYMWHNRFDCPWLTEDTIEFGHYINKNKTEAELELDRLFED